MLKFLSIKLIKFYQKYFSKATCMYIPSCSQYTLEAILKHGFFIGVLLGIRRIFRCTPWCKGGLDKVPDKRKNLIWLL